MRIRLKYFPLLIGLLMYISCKKENNSSPVVKGSLNLEVHAIHHNWDVSGIMIYLERNTTEFPGKDSSVYDYKIQADGYGKATFENLYPGNYYVYASGYDAVWGGHVYGYSPVILNSEHVINNTATLTLEVSE